MPHKLHRSRQIRMIGSTFLLADLEQTTLVIMSRRTDSVTKAGISIPNWQRTITFGHMLVQNCVEIYSPLLTLILADPLRHD